MQGGKEGGRVGGWLRIKPFWEEACIRVGKKKIRVLLKNATYGLTTG